MTVKSTISKYLNKVLILHKFWDGIHMQASLKIPKDTCFSLFVWLVLVFLRHRVFDSEKASTRKEPTFAEKTGCIRKPSGLQVKVTIGLASAMMSFPCY